MSMVMMDAHAYVTLLIDLEVAQVLRRYGTSGALTADRGAQALQELMDFPLVRTSASSPWIRFHRHGILCRFMSGMV